MPHAPRMAALPPLAMWSQHGKPVAYASAHGGYLAFPLQYTNTFTREAVPGNADAAHVSMQTDLCGHSWPLDQPFPVPAPHAVEPPPPHFDASYAQAQPAVQPAHPSAFAHHMQPQPSGPAATFPEMASANYPAENARDNMHGAAPRHSGGVGAQPPSPPPGPPPDMLPELLFDFDRFDADDEKVSLSNARSITNDDNAVDHTDDDLPDIETILALTAGPALGDDDVFKVFSRNPEDGRRTLTAHLHQQQ
jgi:hypothetical protein